MNDDDKEDDDYEEEDDTIVDYVSDIWVGVDYYTKVCYIMGCVILGGVCYFTNRRRSVK